MLERPLPGLFIIRIPLRLGRSVVPMIHAGAMEDVSPDVARNILKGRTMLKNVTKMDTQKDASQDLSLRAIQVYA